MLCILSVLSLINSQLLHTQQDLAQLNKRLWQNDSNIQKILNVQQKLLKRESTIQEMYAKTCSEGQQNADLVFAQNEMVQFYIKAAAFTLVGVLAITVLYNVGVFSSHTFSFKAILPTNVHTFI